MIGSRDTSIAPLRYTHAPPHPHPIIPLVEAALVAQMSAAAAATSGATPPATPVLASMQQQQQQQPPPPPMELEVEEKAAPQPKSRTSSFLASAVRKVAAIKEAASRKLDEARTSTHTAIKSMSKAREVEAFQRQFPSLVVAGAGLLSSHQCKVVSNGVPVAVTLYVTTHALCFISEAAADELSAPAPAKSPSLAPLNKQPGGASPFSPDRVGVIQDVLPLECIASIIPSVALQTFADPEVDYPLFPQLMGYEKDQQQSEAASTAGVANRSELLVPPSLDLPPTSPSAATTLSGQQPQLGGSFNSSTSSAVELSAPTAPPTSDASTAAQQQAPPPKPPVSNFGPLLIIPVPAPYVAPNAITIYTWGGLPPPPPSLSGSSSQSLQQQAPQPQVIQLVDFTDSFVQELITSNEVVLGSAACSSSTPSSTAGAARAAAPTFSTVGAAGAAALDHESERAVAATLLRLRNPLIRALYGIDRVWAWRLRFATVQAALPAIRAGATYAPKHF